MKVFLSLLARHFTFEVADAANIEWSVVPLAVPKGGLPLTVTRTGA
jgi:hypothetical protein